MPASLRWRLFQWRFASLTLEYAREQAPRDQWETRRFRLTNFALTAFWAVAFGCLSGADALANFHKNLPPAFEAAVSLVVLLVAVGITARYPAHLRRRETGTAAAAGSSAFQFPAQVRQAHPRRPLRP